MRLEKFKRNLLAVTILAATTMTAVARAEDIRVSAQLDKTTTDVRSPITLTITLSGDIAGVTLAPPQLPEGFLIAARRQATSFALRGGAMERATQMIFVLVPQKPGAFTLGPFTFRHRGKLFQTEPITITVKKPVLPPTRQLPSERFTI